MRVYLWVHLLCLKDWLQWLPLYVYVKWVIWRDSQLGKLTNWIKLRRNA
ncbi:hypothetical protein [Pectobacterium phage PcaP2EGY]